MSSPDTALDELEPAIQETVDFLNSEECLTMVGVEAYWPKWDSAWWRMVALMELGLASRIPVETIQAVLSSVRHNCLDFFPVTKEELPEGIDPYRQILCHCALGTLDLLCQSTGLRIEDYLPWTRAWYLQNQLQDGGLNCDEAVYTRQNPHSSMVSTLPPMEAVLGRSGEGLTDEEVAFLDRGAHYLGKRELFKSVLKKGEIMNPSWLHPCIPRFYDYDVLRGIRFLLKWSRALKRPLPLISIQDAVEYLTQHFLEEGSPPPVRAVHEADNFSIVQDYSGDWIRGEARIFELLRQLSDPPKAHVLLVHQWRETIFEIEDLIRVGLLIEAPRFE